jgi:hypothetical protein
MLRSLVRAQTPTFWLWGYGASLPLPRGLAMGTQQAKLDVDMCASSSSLSSTPPNPSVHDYYPFALEDGGRMTPMAVDLVDRLAIMVAGRRFPSMGAADSRSLRPKSDARVN